MRPVVLATMALALFVQASAALAQETPPAPPHTELSANINVTNKGISFIPTFTLGRPATIVDVIIRRQRVSFEPQIRYGLDGKPWSILFWGRYRAVNGGRFRLLLGGHPALSFKEEVFSTATGTTERITATRYLALEAVPTVVLSRHVSVGSYYLYGHALDPAAARDNHYLTARAIVSDVPLGRGLALQVTPQLYYLNLSGQDGEYVSATATLSRKGSPISVGTLFSRPIRTGIAGGGDTLWNVSVNYLLR